MYSYEIKQFLHDRSNVLDKEGFMVITDVRKNPQIQSMKYNTGDDTYEMVTSDGYYFNFIVLRNN